MSVAGWTASPPGLMRLALALRRAHVAQVKAEGSIFGAMARHGGLLLAAFCPLACATRAVLLCA